MISNHITQQTALHELRCQVLFIVLSSRTLKNLTSSDKSSLLCKKKKKTDRIMYNLKVVWCYEIWSGVACMIIICIDIHQSVKPVATFYWCCKLWSETPTCIQFLPTLNMKEYCENPVDLSHDCNFV
jgi:hypothetical protein